MIPGPDVPREKRGRLADIRRHLGLLFVLVILLLNWPLLTIPFSRGLIASFVYLFALWGVLILILAYAARRIASLESTRADVEKRGKPASGGAAGDRR